MKATARLLALLMIASGLLLVGCDSSGDEDGTQVTYEVTGNSVGSIAYSTGESDADVAESVDNPDLPWSRTIDATDAEIPIFRVTALTEQAGGNVRVAVLVNGDERDSDSASGSVATATAVANLR